jgi:type I restriction enzyme S subunit
MSSQGSTQDSKLNTQHSPQLRFGEFQDQWTLSNLNSATKVTDCKHRTPEYVEDGVPIVSPGSIRWGKLDTVSPKKRVTGAEYESLMDHCSPQINDMVFSRNQSIGVASRITNSSPFVLGQDTVLISKKRDSLPFTYFQLQTTEVQNDINRLSGGSTFSRINLKDIRQLSLKFPTLPEQEKIAAFLTSVDDRIEQLKRKKSLLLAFKKGCMQRLFSNDECGMLSDEFQHDEASQISATKTIQHSAFKTQHSLRFRQDNGEPYPDWKEKKLGEVAEFSKGKGISKAEIDEKGSQSCIRYGELYTLYSETIHEVHSSTSLSADKLALSKKNDVIIPASGETHIDIATASCVTIDGVALGGDLNIIRSSGNGVFLAYYLNNAMKYKIAAIAQGSSVIHLYASQLKGLKLSIPHSDEQTKIANFLSNLDTQIEQVTQQITQTQTFKRGLLKQMFV